MGLTQEELDAVGMYNRALAWLVITDQKYIHNWQRWKKWNDQQRYSFVVYIENQAERSDGIEFAKTLVARAVALKLTA